MPRFAIVRMLLLQGKPSKEVSLTREDLAAMVAHLGDKIHPQTDVNWGMKICKLKYDY